MEKKKSDMNYDGIKGDKFIFCKNVRVTSGKYVQSKSESRSN